MGKERLELSCLAAHAPKSCCIRLPVALKIVIKFISKVLYAFYIVALKTSLTTHRIIPKYSGNLSTVVYNFVDGNDDKPLFFFIGPLTLQEVIVPNNAEPKICSLAVSPPLPEYVMEVCRENTGSC